jgi:hypothetical protein
MLLFTKIGIFCVSADTKTCGSPLSATSVAIVIIPNMHGMFNENIIFFKN